MGKGTPTIWSINLWFRVFAHWIIEALTKDTRLHRARFAKTHDMHRILNPAPPPSGLLLGTRRGDIAAVSSTKRRSELGNLLVVAPTRGGKGLLAVSQLLTWNHSVVVNDIKGDLFTQTAGYRATLGPVFVIDPTGVGHAYDPLGGAETEDNYRPNDDDTAGQMERRLGRSSQYAHSQTNREEGRVKPGISRARGAPPHRPGDHAAYR